MKEAVWRRDKATCQLCGAKNIPCDVDHWISRRNMSTYFDLNNLTLLCKSCHTKKSFGYADFTERVTDIVREREGEAVMQELRQTANTVKKWQIDEMEHLIEIYKNIFQ